MTMNAADFVANAKAEVNEVDQARAQALMAAGATILDVRDSNETIKGTLPNAKNVSRGMLEWKVETQLEDKDATIIVYCASGGRSALAAQTMQQMGYKNVHSLAGGYAVWVDNGLPISKP